MTSRELQLLENYLDGTLAAADLNELQTFLRTSAAARAKLRALAKIDAGLTEIAAGHAASPTASHDTIELPPSRGRWHRTAAYGLVAASIVGLVMILQAVRTTNERAPSLAKITLLDRCEWIEGSPSRKLGDELAADTLRLRSGGVELAFESGPRITLTGPAEFRIDSASAATLLAGQLVFRNDRPDSTFDLRTPYSELVDLGTSYGVTLGSGFEEVRVFDGEVWRTPKDNADGSVLIDAGSARRFGRALPTFGEEIAANNPQQNEMEPTTNVAPHPVARQAWDGFDFADETYAAGKLPLAGEGWATPWQWHARDPAGNLVEDVPLTITAGEAVGSGIFYLQRRLAQPIRLADEGVIWFSVRFRWDASPDEPRDTFFVTLRSSEEAAAVGPAERFVAPMMSRRGDILVRFGGISERRPMAMQRGRPYRLVGRIESHRDEPDRISLALLPGDASAPASPPESWTITSRPVESDGLLDLLVFHIQSTAPVRIGAIRFANDWPALIKTPSAQP